MVGPDRPDRRSLCQYFANRVYFKVIYIRCCIVSLQLYKISIYFYFVLDLAKTGSRQPIHYGPLSRDQLEFMHCRAHSDLKHAQNPLHPNQAAIRPMLPQMLLNPNAVFSHYWTNTDIQIPEANFLDRSVSNDRQSDPLKIAVPIPVYGNAMGQQLLLQDLERQAQYGFPMSQFASMHMHRQTEHATRKDESNKTMVPTSRPRCFISKSPIQVTSPMSDKNSTRDSISSSSSDTKTKFDFSKLADSATKDKTGDGKYNENKAVVTSSFINSFNDFR